MAVTLFIHLKLSTAMDSVVTVSMCTNSVPFRWYFTQKKLRFRFSFRFSVHSVTSSIPNWHKFSKSYLGSHSCSGFYWNRDSETTLLLKYFKMHFRSLTLLLDRIQWLWSAGACQPSQNGWIVPELTHGVRCHGLGSFCPGNVKIDHRAWIYGCSLMSALYFVLCLSVTHNLTWLECNVTD